MVQLSSPATVSSPLFYDWGGGAAFLLKRRGEWEATKPKGQVIFIAPRMIFLEWGQTSAARLQELPFRIQTIEPKHSGVVRKFIYMVMKTPILVLVSSKRYDRLFRSAKKSSTFRMVFRDICKKTISAKLRKLFFLRPPQNDYTV